MLPIFNLIKRAITKLRKKRAIIIALILVLVTLFMGTFGFSYFENQKLDKDYETEMVDYRKMVKTDPDNATEPYPPEYIDHFTSLYWTITTITTVGYGDFSPASYYGRILFFIIALGGISIISLILGEFASFLVEMKLMSMKGLAKSKVKNHTVIVGWNSITKATYDELRSRDVDVIVIDPEEDPMEMNSRKIPFVSGDPRTREVLERARIREATTVLIPSSCDQDTLMITIKAKQLNPKLRIVTTCDSPENQDTLKNAGVDMVIPTSEVQGHMLANAIDEEKVIKFVLDIMQEDKMGLDVDEFWPEKPMKVAEIPLKRDQKVIVVYIKNDPIVDFKSDMVMNPGDWALVLEKITNK